MSKGKLRQLLADTYGGDKGDWERVFDMTDLGRRTRVFNNEALGIKVVAVQRQGGYPVLDQPAPISRRR